MILSKLRAKPSTRRQRLDRMSIHYQDSLTAAMDRSWDDITANDSLPTHTAFANQHNWCSPMASETSQSEEEDRDKSLTTLNLPQTPATTTMTLRENISDAFPSTQHKEHGNQQYQTQQQQQEQLPAAAALTTVTVTLHHPADHATTAQSTHPGQSTSITSHLTNWLANQSSIKRPPDANAITTPLPCPPLPAHTTTPGPAYTNPTPNKRRNTEMDLPCLEEDFDCHFPPLKSYCNRGDTTVASNNLLQTAAWGKKEEQMEKAQKTKQKQPAEQQNLTPHHNDQQQQQQTLHKHQKHNQTEQAPTVFIPVVKDIASLLEKLRANPSVGNFTTKTLKGDGLRVVCDSRDSHAAVLSTLGESGIRLHTHQAPSDKGYRIFIRHLHRSTTVQWLSNQLGQMGFTVRFARIVKQRFSNNPLNLWELEIDPQKDAEHEKILQIQEIGHQRIKVERPYKSRDPVQCHRCQAFGHSKNYCRRDFRCMKCGGNHPSTSCQKPRNHSSRCANCNGEHVSSYKGCPTFKSFRSKLRANSFRATAQKNQNHKHLRRPREPQYKKTPQTPANGNRFALLDSKSNRSSSQLRQRQQHPTPRQRQQQKHPQQQHEQQQQQRQHAIRREHLTYSQAAGNTSLPRNNSQSSRRTHRLHRQEKRQEQHQSLQQQRRANPAPNSGRNPAENHLANFQARLRDEQQQQLKPKHGQKIAPLPSQTRRQIHFEPEAQSAQQRQQKRQLQNSTQRHSIQQPPQKSQPRHHNNPHNRPLPSTSLSEFFTRQAAHNQRLAASLEENNKNINGIFAQLGSLIDVLKHYMDRLDTVNSQPPLSNNQQRHQLHQQKQRQQIGKDTPMTNDDSDYNFHAIDDIAFTPANDSRHYE